jgi:hypothetical protein
MTKFNFKKSRGGKIIFFVILNRFANFEITQPFECVTYFGKPNVKWGDFGGCVRRMEGRRRRVRSTERSEPRNVPTPKGERPNFTNFSSLHIKIPQIGCALKSFIPQPQYSQ